MQKQPHHKQLWKKDTTHFVVEAQVGPSWVEVARTQQSEEEAARLADRAKLDRSVTAVRVLAYLTRQVCVRVHFDESPPEMRIPKQMKPTGEREACPLCKIRVPVASDGTNRFTFCGGCEKALPA